MYTYIYIYSRMRVRELRSNQEVTCPNSINLRRWQNFPTFPNLLYNNKHNNNDNNTEYISHNDDNNNHRPPQDIYIYIYINV